MVRGRPVHSSLFNILSTVSMVVVVPTPMKKSLISCSAVEAGMGWWFRYARTDSGEVALQRNVHG